MKKILFLLLALVATTASAETRVVNAPFCAAKNTHNLIINRIEITDSTVVMRCTTKIVSWLNPKAKIVAGTQELPLIHTEGIDTTANAQKNPKADVVLTFKGTIPSTATRMDFIEGMGEKQWRFCDIRLDGTRPYGTASDYLPEPQVVYQGYDSDNFDWNTFMSNFTVFMFITLLCVVLPLVIAHMKTKSSQRRQDKTFKMLELLKESGTEINPQIIATLYGHDVEHKDGKKMNTNRFIVIAMIGIALVVLYLLSPSSLNIAIHYFILAGGLICMGIGFSPIATRWLLNKFEEQDAKAHSNDEPTV